MRVLIIAPLGEDYVLDIRRGLEELGFTVLGAGGPQPLNTAERREQVRSCDAVVVSLSNRSFTSVSLWEAGLANGAGKPVLVLDGSKGLRPAIAQYTVEDAIRDSACGVHSGFGRLLIQLEDIRDKLAALKATGGKPLYRGPSNAELAS